MTPDNRKRRRFNWSSAIGWIIFLLIVAGGPIEPGRTYTVAATDWELGTHGGYALAEWNLEIRYDFPTIVREAIEEHLRGAAG